MGDDWFNPTTNKQYKFLTVSGLAPSWVEVPSYASGALSVSNVAVSGGTGSFVGGSGNLAMTVNNVGETVSLATVPPAVINYDVTVQTILYYTSNSIANFTINFRGSASTTLNSIMAIGQSVTAVLMVTNGVTAYYETAITIDGAANTPKWQTSTPSSGNASAIDVYSYTIIKTAASTFTVLASQTKFA